MALLTGPRIAELVAAGTLAIDPFDPAMVGPNSVDLRLGPALKVYAAQLYWLAAPVCGWPRASPGNVVTAADNLAWVRDPRLSDCAVLDPYEDNVTEDVPIPPGGLVLLPGVLYVGATVEFTATPYPYAPAIEGRSTWGRLGVQVHLTAGWGDTGFRGRWVLEVAVMSPVRVRAGDRIAQLVVQAVEGPRKDYAGRYQDQAGVVAARPLPPAHPEA